MSKYKYYFVSPFDQWHFATRKEAERLYTNIGRSTATLYAKQWDGEVRELKSKY